MRINTLQLANYRNYESVVLSPCAGVTALVGDNAQGKTNLLEAVALCCTGRSHRTAKDAELIRWGESRAQVEVEAERADGSHEVALTLRTKERKQIRVNGNAVARSGELMGHLNGVLFAPEHLRMVKDGPAERRRFIDMELSQIRPTYYYALQRYARALDQRNHLLRNWIAQQELRATLPEWDEQLALSGAQIMEYRRGFIEKLSRAARENHLEISGGAEELDVRYKPSIDEEASDAALVDALRRALEEGLDSDLRRVTTGVGPHRDDLILTISGMDVRVYGSQGQQRTAALSLKLSELDVMREETGEWPVLLLDDVMSELDPHRRRHLLGRLSQVQTLVTCTDPADLAGAEVGAAYRVSAGAIAPLPLSELAGKKRARKKS